LAQAHDTSWRDLVAGGRAASLALVLLGIWLIAADSLVTATIMPSVGADLRGFAWFGWTTSGFLVGLVVAGACTGSLTAHFGLRTAMIAAGVGLAIGCAISALGGSMLAFVIGRLVQGSAAGLISGLTYVAISVVFPERHLPRVFAAATSVWGIATFVGPLVGGLFADAGAWRWTFWFFAAQALVFTLLVMWLVPAAPPTGETRKPPVVPLLLLTIGVTAMAVAGVTRNVPFAVVLLGIGLAFGGAAIWRDRRIPGGLLPADASRLGTPLGAAYGYYFSATAAAVGFAVYTPAILQFTNGLSALEAGYLVAVEALAWTGCALLVSGSPERRRLWVRIGAVCIAAGVVLLAMMMASANLLAAAVGGALLGGGFGLSFSFVSQNVMTSLPEAERESGSAAISAVRNTGGAVGASLASIAANFTGFADGLDAGNVGAVSAAIFGVAIPLAAIGVWSAFRLARQMPL
jgi:MFS family permease